VVDRRGYDHGAVAITWTEICTLNCSHFFQRVTRIGVSRDSCTCPRLRHLRWSLCCRCFGGHGCDQSIRILDPGNYEKGGTAVFSQTSNRSVKDKERVMVEQGHLKSCVSKNCQSSFDCQISLVTTKANGIDQTTVTRSERLAPMREQPIRITDRLRLLRTNFNGSIGQY
jgi:hypothetical protein